MPLPRLSVRSADFCSIPFDQRPDGRVAVHRLEHVEAGTVQPNYRKVVIQRCEPPFVGTMLIGDQVGDVPGQEIQGLSCKMAWFVDSNSWLHVSRGALSGVKRRSLHELPLFLQELYGVVGLTDEKGRGSHP